MNHLQCADGRFPDAIDVEQAFGRGRDHIGKAAEAGDQGFGQRLHIAPRNGGEQHQLQQFVIGQGIGPARHEAGTQSRAVFEIMRWLLR